MASSPLLLATTSDWTQATLQISAEAFDCFEGTPARRPLTAGTTIYRLRSRRLAHGMPRHGDRTLASPWWFPISTWKALLGDSATDERSIVSTAREGLAVRESWNPDFDMLIAVVLQTSGFGYEGAARAQPRDDPDLPKLPGGLTQIWIPGLQPHQVMLTTYGSIAF